MRSTKDLFRIAFGFAAILLLAQAAQAGEADGKKVFESKKCAVCHDISGKDKSVTIKDQLAKKGPELWYAGSKFKAGFLEGWLADPKPIRPLVYYSLTARNKGDHAKLAPSEANNVAAYLMSLKASEKPAGIIAQESPKGRITFIKKYACYGCHEVIGARGIVVGGLTGPSLVNTGARLSPDWIYAYLSNAKYYKPVKDMPEYAGIMSDVEMRELASYVATMKK